MTLKTKVTGKEADAHAQDMRPRARSLVQCACTTLVAVGTLLAVTATLVALCWGDIFDAILARELVLSPSSNAFGEWRSPSLPLYFDVYLFNWTNAEELSDGARPQLEQLGPYRYRETREKVELTWHRHNSSVGYRTRRIWHFDAAASNGSLDDHVTTLNVVAASAAYRARGWGYFRQTMLSMGLAMYHQQLWVRKSAGELLFDGYEDPLLDMARTVPPSWSDGAPPVDRFGWFYERNGSLSNDGHMTVSTGEGGVLPGQILRWNHFSELGFLPDACNKLEGSLGEFYPRRLSAPTPRDRERRQDGIVLFSPDLCRPLPLTFERRGLVHDLPVLHYAAGDRMLDNGSTYDENACYCGGECVPAGALNVSACRFGSPAFISLPHFLHADPVYRADVDGMAPDHRTHSFYIAIEPTSGIPLDVAARFQLNILMAPSPNIALYASVPRIMFPVLWVEQRVLVPAETARAVGAARTAAAWGGVGAAAIAAAAFTLSLAAMAPSLLRRRRRLHRAPDPPLHRPAAPELSALVPPPPLRPPDPPLSLSPQLD